MFKTGKPPATTINPHPQTLHERGPQTSLPPPRLEPREVTAPPKEITEKADRIFKAISIDPPIRKNPEKERFGVFLKPEYLGEPFFRTASTGITVGLYDYQEQKWIRTVFSTASESLFLPDLIPGTFSCNLSCNANTSNPADFPGDFFGSSYFYRDKIQTDPVPVPMKKFLHVIEPKDNSEILSSGAGATGSIKISWDALPEVDEYEIELGMQPHGWPKETFTTTGTSLVATVTPDSYRLSVKGIRKASVIASSFFHFRYTYTLQDGTDFTKDVTGDLPVTIRPSKSEPADFGGKFFFAGSDFFASSGVNIEMVVTRKFSEAPIVNPVEINSGTFIIRQLPPGAYSAQAWIDANPENPMGFSGDYYGETRFHSPPVNRGGIIHLYKFMRLRYPEDSDYLYLTDRLDAGGFAKMKPPVTISWDSMGEGVKYYYYFNPPGISGVTTSTSLIVDLPMGGISNMTLKANSNLGEIGRLIIGGRKNRPSYPFMVGNLPENPVTEANPK